MQWVRHMFNNAQQTSGDEDDDYYYLFIMDSDESCNSGNVTVKGMSVLEQYDAIPMEPMLCGYTGRRIS